MFITEFIMEHCLNVYFMFRTEFIIENCLIVYFMFIIEYISIFYVYN